jgi:hypothetical protein
MTVKCGLYCNDTKYTEGSYKLYILRLKLDISCDPFFPCSTTSLDYCLHLRSCALLFFAAVHLIINKSGNGVFHNVVHKITSGFWSFLSVLKKSGNNEMQANKRPMFSLNKMPAGIYGKLHLWSYVNEALSWISMAEIQFRPATFIGSFSYKISLKFVELFTTYMKNPIYGLIRTRLCYGSTRLKIRIAL